MIIVGEDFVIKASFWRERPNTDELIPIAAKLLIRCIIHGTIETKHIIATKSNIKSFMRDGRKLAIDFPLSVKS